MTPPTNGSIEIKQGSAKNITINHGSGGGNSGRRRSWPLPPPIGPPRPFRSRARVDRAMGDAPYRQRHENLAGVDVLPNNPPRRFFTKEFVILGTVSHGLHRRLWAIRGCSAQGRTLTGPWVTPPTAGAMKIERGVACNSTIHASMQYLIYFN